MRVYALLGMRLWLRRSVSAIGSVLVAEVLPTSPATRSLGWTTARCMSRTCSALVADRLGAVARVLDVGPSGARTMSRAPAANAAGCSDLAGGDLGVARTSDRAVPHEKCACPAAPRS